MKEMKKMKKEYSIFNEEPNVNILGLDPILLAFYDDELEKFAGRNLSGLVYELESDKLRASAKTQEWIDLSRFYFEKIKNEPKFEQAIVNNIEDRADKIYKLSKKTLEKIKKHSLDKLERKEIIKKLFSLFISICTYGLIGPIIEFGDRGLGRQLDRVLEKKTNKKNKYLSLLSYRYEENFDQKAQKDLANIAQIIYQNKKLKILFSENNYKIEEKLPLKIKKQLQEYVFIWGWLTYGYMGPEYTITNAINDIKGMLSLNIPPEKYSRRIDEELEDRRKQQQQVLKKLDLGSDDVYIVEVAQNFTSTKYLRTKMMFLANFTINNLLKSFAIEEGLSMKQMGVCTVKEILKYFKTGKLPAVDILNKRLKHCLLITGKSGEKFLLGKEAKKWMKENVKEEKVDKNISKIYGQVACPGLSKNVRGVVKIINLTKEMNKFNQGEILVSIATTPDIVPAMKKAAAIITDIGGLTCHAAIVSRELNKPCIIGTKIATKVLKDGDVVEVDADKGIVRIIKK